MKYQCIGPIHVLGALQGGIVAPATDGRKAPGLQPFQRHIGPGDGIRIVLPGRVTGIFPVIFKPGSARIDAADAQRKERLSFRRYQPPHASWSRRVKGAPALSSLGGACEALAAPTGELQSVIKESVNKAKKWYIRDRSRAKKPMSMPNPPSPFPTREGGDPTFPLSSA